MIDHEKSLFVFFAVFAVVLSACAGSVQETKLMEKPTEVVEEQSIATETMVDKPAATEEMPGDQPMEDTPEIPAWFKIPMTDVNSGQAFTIADFKGKVVLVENMAIWCTTCLRQQNEVVELHKKLGEQPDLVSVGLDIDPNEDAAMLKQYIESKGFHWTYAVAALEVNREIGQLYGAQFLNPPSAPMLIIDRAGGVHPLPFGVKSAADLLQEVQQFLNEGM
jgi:thiol-disulfide isomerase/thioredoxin